MFRLQDGGFDKQEIKRILSMQWNNMEKEKTYFMLYRSILKNGNI